MVDIHSHILPGIDDGSDSLETSVEMLRMAAEDGTTDIVATPHANLKYAFQPEVITEKIGELQQAAGDSIRIHRGCDFHLSFDNIQDCFAHPEKYTINHKRYLLVEFSDLQIAKITENVLARMRDADIVPVITHPERNHLLQTRFAQMSEWIGSGCLVQVTALSLLGRFGKTAKSVADELLSRNMVQFIASDAHDTRHRPPLLKPAFEYVAAKYGPQRARLLFEINPRATLTGDYVDAEDPEPPPRKWYHFWS